MNSTEPKSLLEEPSPNGNIVAIVEEEANTCYFYLSGEPSTNFGVKSCWVRNLRAAPPDLNVASMREGVAPMLPRSHCRHPNGAPHFEPASLSVLWAEEGDAAALQENSEIIAIIPSWSGTNEFHGYARDCIGQSPLCWELGTPETNEQFSRYERAAECWRAWDTGGVWNSFQESMMFSLEERFGKHSKYYAIDGGQWPPKALLRIHTADSVILVTVGMALRPQPKVELHHQDPVQFRRVELAAALSLTLPEEAIQSVARYMSAQSGYPWSFYTFLGDGHTIPSDAFAAISAQKFPFVLLQSLVAPRTAIELPPFRGDPISLLWITPISESERHFAEAAGSSELAERLRNHHFDWSHNFQRKVVA